MGYYRHQKKTEEQKRIDNQPKEDFAILAKAKSLLKYTLHQSSKKDIKAFRNTVFQEIIKCNVDIIRAVIYANSQKDNTQERLKYQNITIQNCEIMLTLIEALLDISIISNHTCEVWSKMCMDIKYMTMAWRKRTAKDK